MRLTGKSGDGVYVDAAEVVGVFSTADTGAAEPLTSIRLRDGSVYMVAEPSGRVTDMVESDKSAAAHARLHAEGRRAEPAKVVLRAVAAGLEAAATQVRGDDPSPVLRTVARMLFSAAQELGAHGAASVRP